MNRRMVIVGGVKRGVKIGGGGPIIVQSMTTTDTRDIEATVSQIVRLQQAGCEIVRVAVPDTSAAAALPRIKERIAIPLVADIHFDHRLALASIRAGVDMLRLNPGNITDPAKVEEVAAAAATAGIPIRIGANSGSLAPEFRDSHGRATAAGMVASALQEIRLLESLGFTDLVVSLKGTDVPMTIDAYRAIAREVDYPLHIGITEAGTPWGGTIRSAVGLGVLLAEGLGDTLRISLTGDPVEEVRVAYEILSALNLRQRGVVWRVCPTCGRTKIDLLMIANKIQQELTDLTEPLTIALMGCIVNGPGEAKDADIALFIGTRNGTICVDGEPVMRAVPEDRLVAEFVKTVRAYKKQKGGSR
ncbi:flavodoxin-dependent (E)-4-hydroxy-3-methylbut-2-enyl-diphosphate synthase [Candidatus Bipolaricaulota bacterium]|nr:flavodoxin-dependent (E)-4-hydroxy-3-methylbut-2-enyl-diphosphate synthase [Candidatus Bipolaricaulota bacterium]